MRAFLILLSLLLLNPVEAAIADEESGVVVIVNTANKTDYLSRQIIARFYSNYKLEWRPGEAVILYDLLPTNPVRKRFSMQVLERDASRVAERWAHMKITNQAINPPMVLKSEWMIIRKVARQENAIGYVSLRAFKATHARNVKVIYSIKGRLPE